MASMVCSSGQIINITYNKIMSNTVLTKCYYFYTLAKIMMIHRKDKNVGTMRYFLTSICVHLAHENFK